MNEAINNSEKNPRLTDLEQRISDLSNLQDEIEGLSGDEKKTKQSEIEVVISEIDKNLIEIWNLSLDSDEEEKFTELKNKYSEIKWELDNLQDEIKKNVEKPNTKKLKELESKINKLKKLSELPDDQKKDKESEINSLISQIDLELKEVWNLALSSQERTSFDNLKSQHEQIKLDEKSWREKNWKTVLIWWWIVWWAWLLWKWIKSLFGGKDKKEESWWDDEWFFDKWIWKWIKRIWIWVWAVFAWTWTYNNRDKIKSWFDPESAAEKKEKHEKFLKYRNDHKSEFDPSISYNQDWNYWFEYNWKKSSFNDLVVFDKDWNLDEIKTKENINKWKNEIDEKSFERTSLEEASEILRKNPELNNLWEKVNEFYWAIWITHLTLWESDFEDWKSWLLLAQLWNMSSGNVWKLLGKWSYEKLIDQLDTWYFQQIINWALSISKKAWAKALVFVAGLIPNITPPWSWKNIMSSSEEALRKRANELLKNNETEFEKHAQSIFIKWMQIVTYLDAVKDQYLYNLIKNKLSENESFSKKSTEDQDELIFEKMEDSNFLESNKILDQLKKFDSMSLIDLANTKDVALSNALGNPYLNENLVDSLNDIDGKENEWLEWIDEAETDEDIKDIAEELLLDINGLGYNTWYAWFQTIYNSYFETDAEKMHDMAVWQYASLMEWTLDKINLIKNKTPLTDEDKQDLKDLIEWYSKTKKSMLLAWKYKAENTDESFMLQYALPFWEGTKKQYFYTKAQVEKWNVWWVILSGMVLDLSSYPLRWVASIFINPNLWRVVRSSPTVKLTKFVLDKTFVWRPILNLTGRITSYLMWAKFYKSYWDNASKVLAYDYINWKISYKRMVRILKQLKWTNIAEERQVFKRLFGTSDDVSRQLLKINELNPKLIKFMFEPEKLWWFSTNKIHSMYDLAKKWKINFKKTDNLKFVDDIIQQSEKDSKIWVKILSRLKKYKNFAKFKELAESKTKLRIPSKLLTYEDDIARAIAKNISKIESIEDINKVMKHIATNWSKISDKWAFFSNAMKNIKNLKKSKWDFWAENVKKLKLNEVPEKLKFNRIRDSLRWATKALEKARKTLPKAQIPLINKQLREIRILRNARFESFKALEFGFWKSSILSYLHQNSNILTKLLGLDKSVLKQIADMKKFTDVKMLLNTHWVDWVSDDVIRRLTDMKKVKNIENMLSYAKEYPKYQAWLGKVRWVLKSPWMKYVWKMFWKVFGWLAIWVWVINGVEKYNEWTNLIISGQNITRWKMKQEAGIVTWATWALAWALMFVPWVGWVLWAVVWASEILVWAYYETVDKYLQNFNDLTTKTDLYIKETIISMISWIRNNDRSWKDDWSRLVQFIKSTPPYFKTLIPSSFLTEFMDEVNIDAEWFRLLEISMDALIHLDELKKHPYAAINYDIDGIPEELQNNWITPEIINEEKNKLTKNKEGRLSYFKWNYDSISQLISDEDLESWSVMSRITGLINETDMFIQVENISTKQDLENYMESIENKLDEKPYKLFESLSNKQLLYYYHHRYSLLDSSDKINTNIKVFEGYMKYKSFKWELNMFDTANTGLYEKDHTELITFFTEFNVQPKIFSNQEVESVYVDMTLNKYSEVEAMFNVSSNPIQNGLYRIIRDVIWCSSIKNNKEEIQKFLYEWTNQIAEKHYWLYFDNDWDLNINGSSRLGRDDEFQWDSDIWDLIKEIDRQFGAWDATDQWSGDKYINKELWQIYINIFEQEKQISENKNEHKRQILSHIKQYGWESWYIRLPLHDIELWIKIWITDIAKHLYKIKDWKIITYKPWGSLSWEII